MRWGQIKLNVNLNWVEPDELVVTHCKEYSVINKRWQNFILPSEVISLLGVGMSPSFALHWRHAIFLVTMLSQFPGIVISLHGAMGNHFKAETQGKKSWFWGKKKLQEEHWEYLSRITGASAKICWRILSFILIHSTLNLLIKKKKLTTFPVT